LPEVKDGVSILITKCSLEENKKAMSKLVFL